MRINNKVGMTKKNTTAATTTTTTDDVQEEQPLRQEQHEQVVHLPLDTPPRAPTRASSIGDLPNGVRDALRRTSMGTSSRSCRYRTGISRFIISCGQNLQTRHQLIPFCLETLHFMLKLLL